MSTVPLSLSPERIDEASRVIDPVFLRTPQFVSDALSERLGVRVVLKVETLNPLRSFKGRGTDYYLHRLGSGAQTLVAASAGNFGQGLAYAARSRGIPVVIFAAHSANPLKVERMRQLGAEVRLAGDDVDAAKREARAWVAEQSAAGHDLVFVEDGAEPAIAEGAGSMAVELTQWPETIDAVLAPVGNGALVTGLGCWFKATRPTTQVIGVCASGAPAMEQAWRTGELVTAESVDTIADGIAVREPIALAVNDMRAVVDDVVLVDDDLLIDSIRLVFDTLGVVIEPAGVAGIAACMTLREQLQGATVAIPLCGGYVTPQQFARWVSRA